MVQLKLPLVDYLVSMHSSLSLSRVRIIGTQHILETTHSMFQSLYELGLKPENISIIGKCYSTCKEVYDEMLDDGIDVSSDSFAYCSHRPWDEIYSEAVYSFISDRARKISPSKFDLVIVLDDGGKSIDIVSNYVNHSIEIVAIEQTTAGYEAVREKVLNFPVINVARSPVKLELESPMIAEAAAERLAISLNKANITPDRAMVIGGGAIGAAIKRRLSDKIHIDIFDLDKTLRTTRSDNFVLEIGKYPLIIGCTGRTSLPSHLHSRLRNGVVLVSVSSADREFDAVHLRRQLAQNDVCHTDLRIGDLLLVNSGFPVNFDGERENIEPHLIQLTIALMTAGILQGVSLPNNEQRGVIHLDPTLEGCIAEKFVSLREKSTTQNLN